MVFNFVSKHQIYIKFIKEFFYQLMAVGKQKECTTYVQLLIELKVIDKQGFKLISSKKVFYIKLNLNTLR